MSNLAREPEHIKHNVSYPTDKKGLVAVCNAMTDIPMEDRDWFAKAVPEDRIKGPEEVMTTLIARVRNRSATGAFSEAGAAT